MLRPALMLFLCFAFVGGRASYVLAQAPALARLGAPQPQEPAQPSKDKDKVKDNGEDKKEEKDNDKNGDKEKDKDEDSWYNAHGQATVVSQGNWKFRSPYVGPNSLLPNLNYRTTATTTFFAARVWDGGELVINPEMAGGVGLSSTLGLAGFPNGEATRVGVPQPTPYFARFLFKQVFALGDELEKVEDAVNQVAGYRPVSRLTVRAGKMSATDIFDDNSYSHDPRTQFLNWALMYNGAWDYPANARGYTYGATFEFNHKDWALRYGVFAEPTVANGQDLDPHFLQANGHALELEQRYDVNDRPGKIRLMAYLNNAHMGNYRVALREMPVDPIIADTRAYRVKYGFGLNLEQELSDELGFFARLGWDDGHTETWAFTEIDATVALGLAFKGKRWSRPDDVVGLGVICNGLSTGHRDYLAAGGLGFIIGDGALRYGPEEILETYYNFQFKKGINLTLDLQGVNNPAYNRDRGPVAIAGVRMHFEF